MKRIVSFFILLALLIVVLLLPATETPVAPAHPLPVGPILCYLAMVAAAALVVAWQVRGRRTGTKRKDGLSSAAWQTTV